MKERFGADGEVIFWTLVTLVIIFIISLGSLAINGTLNPIQKMWERKAVEQSKSFTDGNNVMLQKYILEYSRLDTKIVEAKDDPTSVGMYKDQQTTLVGTMCTEIATMDKSTVNPSTLSFVNSHGGCR